MDEKAIKDGAGGEPVVLDAVGLKADGVRAAGFVAGVTRVLGELVRGGAALGWVEAPGEAEVRKLCEGVLRACEEGDGALRVAYAGGELVGLGYWLRYARPTHRPHADLEKVAVAAAAQGRGIGRELTRALVADARAAGIEVLTLDARGDNENAIGLYRALGFSEYGRLRNFVAVGERRYDKVFMMVDLRR